MKTYMCDICGSFVGDPMRRIYMREVYFKKEPTKRQRVHLCNVCFEQIAYTSHSARKKDGADNER